MIDAKVIHIITKLELGGAQQNTLHTLRHLDRQHFAPFLVAGPGGDLFDDIRPEDNFLLAPDLVREIRPARDTRALVQLRRHIKAIQQRPPADAPVIVHTHSSKAGILGRWAAWACRAPVCIHSVHGFGFHPGQPALLRWFYILLERLSASVTTHFIAVSRANITQGCGLGLFTPDTVTLIRSGIDIAAFQTGAADGPALRRELGLPQHSPVVTMVACLKPQKDPLCFVELCAAVHRQIPAACFLLVGDGQLRSAVERAVADRGLQRRFSLTGWRRDIPRVLGATDVLVLTSRWEGLPRVLPQAMAAGVPAVVTSVDGAPEAIHDGVNGYVLPPGDIPAMAEQVCTLLRSPERARAMGAAGRAMVQEFDAATMVRQQELLYQRLLSTFRTV